MQETTEIVAQTRQLVGDESYLFKDVSEEQWLKIGVPEDLVKQI